MTIPAENFTIGKRIIVATTTTMSFPFASITGDSPTICPYKLFPTLVTSVVMCYTCTLAIGWSRWQASSCCSLPSSSNNDSRKRHFTPPSSYTPDSFRNLKIFSMLNLAHRLCIGICKQYYKSVMESINLYGIAVRALGTIGSLASNCQNAGSRPNS